MTDYARAAWVGSPNFSLDRDGHNPDWTAADPNTWIVLHTMVGSEASARARFQQPAQQASSHYGVCLDGRVFQYVAEKDGAWTNGTLANNPGSNLDSITIEHEDDGDYNGPRTPALYEASAQLVADISRRRGIPLVHRAAGGGVLGHKECAGAQTSCPDGLDIARIIARANEILHPPQPQPPPGTPEWQKNLSPLPALQTFPLIVDVPIINLVTGQKLSFVAKGANLQVAFETSVGGEAFWMTSYGSTHGNGLRKADVAAALAPPQPQPQPEPHPDPQPDLPPKPPADLWPWLDALLAFLKRVFAAR